MHGPSHNVVTSVELDAIAWWLMHRQISMICSRAFGQITRRFGWSRHYAAEAALADSLSDILHQSLADIKAAGTYKKEFAITSPQGAVIRMRPSLELVSNAQGTSTVIFLNHDSSLQLTLGNAPACTHCRPIGDMRKRSSQRG